MDGYEDALAFRRARRKNRIFDTSVEVSMPQTDEPAAQTVALRGVTSGDIAVFFEQQRDPEAHRMAAMSGRDPDDRDAFETHWRRLLDDDAIIKMTIVTGDRVAGNIVCFELLGQRAVGYWLGRAFWGKGIATAALASFLDVVPERPLYARVAKDNIASQRVLEKCGFRVTAEDAGYSSARGTDVEEWIMRLE